MNLCARSYFLIYLVLHLLSCSVAGFEDQNEREPNRFLRQLQECNPKRNEGCGQFFTSEYPSPLSLDHKCEDYVKKERGNEAHIKRILSEESWLEEQVVGRMQNRYQNFFYVNGSQPSQEFLLCGSPKSGITRAKMLVMRITGLHGNIHNGGRYKQVPYTFANHFSKPQRESILFNPNITRIKLVRNPYIRAISGYKEKIVSNNWKKNGKYVGWSMVFDKIPSFDDWVAQLYQNYKQNKYIDDHFAPQYLRCWQHLGLKFDYVLKVERMNYWYPCFVQQFDLWKYVMRGWPKENQCYLSTPDVPCNGPQQRDQGNLVQNSTMIQGINHQKNSQDYFAEYYKNETTARRVTEIFLNDIVKYDYPFWYEMKWSKYSSNTNYA